MRNDARLLDILGRFPGKQADFEHTKPSEGTLADDIAVLFGVLGVQAMRASLVDLGLMRCTHAWHITEVGAMVEDTGETDPDRSLPTAMATIVKLSPAGPEQTQIRRLDSHSWAFAWLAEDRQVAVVEARYRNVRGDHGDADVALVRQVCDASVRATLAAASSATPDVDLRLAKPIVEMARQDSRSKGAALRARAFDALPTAPRARSPGTSSWLAAPQRVVLAVLALGLVVAGILFAQQQYAMSLRAESAQLQAKADATMKQMVGKALAEGDYGEVQAELASFAALKYFESALVANARGRVIAATGPIQGIRMGDPLATDVAGSAHVIELNDNSERSGQLLIWGPVAQNAPGFGEASLVTKAMLIVFGAAVAAALLLLLRRQRRGTADH